MFGLINSIGALGLFFLVLFLILFIFVAVLEVYQILPFIFTMILAGIGIFLLWIILKFIAKLCGVI